MPICIYCLKEKGNSNFNREHVLPESFGTFTNNLTLLETVCKDCNQYFGDELELFLGRDTFEGMQRYLHGIKGIGDFKFRHDSRIQFHLKEKGDWCGAIMCLKTDPARKMVIVEPVAQVGLLKQNDAWHFFDLKKLPHKDELLRQGFIVKGPRALKILFNEEWSKSDVFGILKKSGINLTQESEPLVFDYKGKNVDVEIRTTIDKIIFRGIAKIVFNYLTYVAGVSFVLSDDFTKVRRFIRYGEMPDWKPVLIQKSPILHEEKRFNIRQTKGHMVTVNWNRAKTVVISQVTLFNMLVYKIVFCKRFNGIYRLIASGHHFDIENRKISKLVSLPTSFYIP